MAATAADKAAGSCAPAGEETIKAGSSTFHLSTCYHKLYLVQSIEQKLHTRPLRLLKGAQTLVPAAVQPKTHLHSLPVFQWTPSAGWQSADGPSCLLSTVPAAQWPATAASCALAAPALTHAAL
jgi:hypothetical protein